MELIEKIILIGLLGAVLSLVLKKYSPPFSFLVSVATGIIIFYMIANMLSYTVMSVKTLFLKTNIDSELLESVLKICGIGILSEYFCSVIKDAGEEGIAKKVELSAKTVIFTLTLPIILRIINSIWGVL